MSNKKFHHVVPFIPVRNLLETIDYYRRKLGFYNEWFWEETDAGICRDELNLLFNFNPAFVDLINTEEQRFELMWFVDSIDDIYMEFKNNLVHIVRELKDEPWGQREFAFIDINGYYIRVSQQLPEEESAEV